MSESNHKSRKDNEIIASNGNALNAISIRRRRCRSATAELWINYEWSHHLSKHVKSAGLRWQSLVTVPCLSIRRGTTECRKSDEAAECEIESAERWKIAYQIASIRLNCSHKYCFSHAHSDDDSPPLQYVRNRDEISRIFPANARRLCSCRRRTARERRVEEKHSLRAACHQKVLFRNSHKCILHTFAGNNRKN